MPTYRSLQSLLRAFNITLAPGESFRNNIPGAGDTVDLLSYILESWDGWTSSDVTGVHASGTSIHFTFNINAGSKWYEQLRISSPTGMVAYFDIEADPGTAAPTITAGTWNGQSGNTITVLLTGKAKFGTYSGGSSVLTMVRNDYKFYTNPDRPFGNATEDWEIILSMNAGSYSPPSLTPETYTLVIGYPATTLHSSGYSFNDALLHTESVQVQPYDAGPPPNNLPQIEWHLDGSFTSLVSTDPSYTFGVDAGNSDGYFYVRSRLSSSDPWTSFPGNPIHWHDRRY